jgi:hypothetical protein
MVWGCVQEGLWCLIKNDISLSIVYMKHANALIRGEVSIAFAVYCHIVERLACGGEPMFGQ